MTKHLSILFLVLLFISCSSSGTDDSEQLIFELPEVSTGIITNISENSATVGGNVTSDGGSNISEKGIVWAQSQNPTISDNHRAAQQGTGQFSIELTGLESETNYFIRAYATNSEGTAYGNQQQFITLEAEPQQKIHEGDVVLSSQNEVESFGNQGYTEINGSLTINTANATSNIDDLSSLVNLEIVRGNLWIAANQLLSSLNGLDNLQEVGESLQVLNNPEINDLDAFGSLTMAGAIVILNNSKLEDINQLNSLEEIEGGIIIQSNPSLRTIDAFNHVESLNGVLFIEKNAALLEVSGFENLKSCLQITIYENDNLLEVNSFKNLDTIGSIRITDNPALNVIVGFNNLIDTQQDIGSIDIENNPSLMEFDAFQNLTLINGSLKLSGNGSLETISLPSLEKIEANLEISLNTKLISTVGFTALEIVNGDVIIAGNNELVQMSGFDSLNEIGGDLTIGNNSSLESLETFENLSVLGGSINIFSNASLTNFCGLTHLLAGGWSGDCFIIDNNYNLDCSEIIEGACSS